MDLKEVAKHPNYDAAATGASKSTIFVFIGTFLYMLFGTDISPGLLGGAMFFSVGIFVVSFVIALPLFIARIKLPALSLIIHIVDYAVTIVATKSVYLWLFAT